MSSERFHLTSRWRVRAPAQSVFDVLVQLGSLSTWWPGVRSAPLGSSQEVVGRRAQLEIFGLLPIALRAELEITAAEPGRNVEVVSRGELQGTGEWRLRELSGVTSATFIWDVRLDRPGLRTLAHSLRPLLVLSHRFAMWRGERGLRRLLERGKAQLATSASASRITRATSAGRSSCT
jgi:hypothetical protein